MTTSRPSSSASSIAWRTTVRYMRGSFISGLSHAAKSRSHARALYWLVVFLAGLALTLRVLAVLINEFLDYPVVTSSEIATQSSVAFPAITICNLNRQVLLIFFWKLLHTAEGNKITNISFRVYENKEEKCFVIIRIIRIIRTFASVHLGSTA